MPGQFASPNPTPEKKSALREFFQPLVDKAAQLDPRDILMQLLGPREMETPPISPVDPMYTDPSPQLNDALTDMMNRQSNIKKTFGKIPGR
jgi:hypothetical protein